MDHFSELTAMRHFAEPEEQLPSSPNHGTASWSDQIGYKQLISCRQRGRIAVVVHVFYKSVWPELSAVIANIEEPFDLFVSLVDGTSDDLKDTILLRWPFANCFTGINRGRDILPFVSLVQSSFLSRYELVCKLHTKRSLYKEDGDSWRKTLIEGILGTRETVRSILGAFDTIPSIGMVVADHQIYSGRELWLANVKHLNRLLPNSQSTGYVSERFAGGSTFWIRGGILNGICDLQLKFDEFEPEPLATDGTLAHAIERLFSLLCYRDGKTIVELSMIAGSGRDLRPTLDGGAAQIRCKEIDLANARFAQRQAEMELSTVQTELAELRANHTELVKLVNRPFHSVRNLLPYPLKLRLRKAVDLTRTTLKDRGLKRVSTHVAGPRGEAHSTSQRLPLRIAPAARSVSVLTDTVSPGHLFGGVSTALILAAALAERLGAKLQVITQIHKAHIGLVRSFLRAFGTSSDLDLSCAFWPAGERPDHLPHFHNDVLLTTSWWTTEAARAAFDSQPIIQLLQEDERMFYPHGDDRLRCTEQLNDASIKFVVNSEVLFRHFTEASEPLKNVVCNGCWFEPAFPIKHYYDDAEARLWRQPKNFLFYARPKHPRNLYRRGLDVLSRSIREGILEPGWWRFIFVGRDVQEVELPFGHRPEIRQLLPWPQYCRLIRRIDVGLSLIDTPHPSYPPLDLAASGAVVVTNKCGIKTSLTNYSENILCAEPTIDGLVDAVKRAIAIASNEEVRFANYTRNGISRSWRHSLEPALRCCEEWAKT